MKALNRQQRKAAIWKFVILYFITVVLILITFISIGKFSEAKSDNYKKERDEALSKLNACESAKNTLSKNLTTAQNTAKDRQNQIDELKDQISKIQSGITPNKVESGSNESSNL